MKISPQPTGWQTAIVLTIGILSVSTAAVLVRLATREAHLSTVGFSLVLAASRLVLASAVLLPAWQPIRRNPPHGFGMALCCRCGNRSRCPLCHLDHLAVLYVDRGLYHDRHHDFDLGGAALVEVVWRKTQS